MKKDDTTHRGMRDEAGVGPAPRAATELTPLRELKHVKVSDGEPDIRGWNVFTATGRELGEVEDLLVDTDRGEVVMLDIDLKRDDRHTLAPIKSAWIDREHKRVVLNTTQLDADEAIPAYRRTGTAAGTATGTAGAAAAGAAAAASGTRDTSHDDHDRFSERYARAYGNEAWHDDRDFVVRRPGDDLRISRPLPPPNETSGEPRRLADTSSTRGIDRDRDRVPDAIEQRAAEREVRFPPNRDEVVIERRPVVMEEVVVRRRVVDPNEPLDASGGSRGPEHRPPTDERR